MSTLTESGFPMQLEMEEGDQIDAHLEQVGGRGGLDLLHPWD
jgi:hypothetical protein